MRTRQKRLNYRVLNDESDGEALAEDQTDQASEPSEPPSNLTRTLPACQDDVVILASIPGCELLPSESVSQVLVSPEGSTDAGTSITSQVSSRCSKRPAPATEWIWGYFEATDVDCPWVIKRTNKRRLVDREICWIIGHGLTDEFEYRERLLEFAELQGIHSGENLSIAVENMLIELGLEDKLSSITGDNASNNEAMASELFLSLSDRPGVEEAMPAPLYRGLDSYIRCLAHVLNLIVKDILHKFVAQVNKFLNLQEELPPFTLQDWSRLEQIHTVLHKFNVLTLFISKRNPQISLADPIYYELHELLDDVREGKDDFAKLDRDIIAAVKEGMKKYEKCYSIMDNCDTTLPSSWILESKVKWSYENFKIAMQGQ
ncbi:hypothetical protein N7508_011207 [Penicillium antarcticum]|uniref:uncharacterized protein n=1 Tax=Penicillium antarcticum TaxID=416450 RepID=UPI00238734DD|nr:uncharacterized protein N7508_011207 [Penicillium antarcticum]KAJ5288432.1 hypothetical protein N7508_011207 [Penicillium antarcticum]